MRNTDTQGLNSFGDEQAKDNDLLLIKNLSVANNNNRFVTRFQIQKFYEVPEMTLSDNIKRLKEDGLVNGTEIRVVATDGRKRLQEVYDVSEIIAIGFKLRSDKAIRLQRSWIATLIAKNKLYEIELSYAWNKSDNEDLYR